MTLSGFALRNTTVTWWRSLTLGLFIFTVVFVAVLASSFSLAVRERVEKVIVRGLTGHIQVRSEKTMEGDMVEQYDTGWDDIAVLPPSATAAIGRIVSSRMPGATAVARVRRSVSLFNGTRREKTMMIGAPAGSIDTTDAFLLAAGRPFSGAGAREVLLTQEQAKNLKVGVGDRLTIVARNRDGRNAALSFTVVGIGDFVMLSLFSYKACYVDASSARELVGLEADEATDIIITLPRQEEALASARLLARECNGEGVPALVQADELFLSEELSSEEGMLPNQKKKPEKIRISTWQDMGKTFRGIGEAIFLLLAALVVTLLLIVSILIGNLVTLMGIERYREIGTLRAVGFGRRLVTRLFMGEIMGVTAVFAAAGAAAGAALVLLLGRAGLRPPVSALEFVMGKSLHPVLSLAWVAGLLAAVEAFAFAASFLPARKACALPPAEAMSDRLGGGG